MTDWKTLSLIVPVFKDRITELREWSEENDHLIDVEVAALEKTARIIEGQIPV